MYFLDKMIWDDISKMVKEEMPTLRPHRNTHFNSHSWTRIPSRELGSIPERCQGPGGADQSKTSCTDEGKSYLPLPGSPPPQGGTALTSPAACWKAESQAPPETC